MLKLSLMRKEIPFILILSLLSLLQSTVLPINLVLIFLLLWAFLFEKINSILLWAFVAGLILDFLSGNILGISSFLFLAGALVVVFAKKTGILSNIFLFTVCGFVLLGGYETIFNFIFQHLFAFNFTKAIWETLLIFPLYPVAKLFLGHFSPPDILQLSFKEKLR